MHDMDTDFSFHLSTATHLANFMDNRFSFLGKRFGVSALIDLIPGIGDVVDALLAMYLIWIAIRMKLPDDIIGKMFANIIFSFFLGLIPIAGDIASYIFYRPNMRNLRLLQEYVRTHHVIQGKIIAA